MSAGKTDTLMDILATLYDHQDPPFASHDELYESIDAIPYGDCPWQSFSVKYSGPLPKDPLSWMLADYDVVTDENGWHEVCDLMSGQWAWDQSELIAQDPDTHRAMFAPIILGSNKMTVSVGTGNMEYYPLYISLGNVHNCVHHSHSSALSILAFLSILKTGPTHKDDIDFCYFCHQLFHSSLAAILQPQALLACIVQGWLMWPLTICSCMVQNSSLDSGSRPQAHAYSEQLHMTMDPQTLWNDYRIVGSFKPFTAHFPHVDIHEMITPDLLHQFIKGIFKDHLVTWVNKYLEQNYPRQQALEIIAEIDCHRLAAIPLFPGLHQFPEDVMVHAIAAFLKFCYIAQKSVITERDLDTIDDAVCCFYLKQEIFKEVGVCEHFSLPHQHAMVHYHTLIKMFSLPNGICSSITESQHIKAVKEPWHHSNRYEALRQKGMLDSTFVPAVRREDIATEDSKDGEEEDKSQAVEGDKSDYDVQKLVAAHYGYPELVKCTQHYLYDQLNPNAEMSGDHVSLCQCPSFDSDIKVFNSMLATYYAPSNHSGHGRMHCNGGPVQYDCILVDNGSSENDPLCGLLITCCLLFFSFKFQGHSHSCVLVEWFLPFGDALDPLTGMWVVVLEVNAAGHHV
ncbi:hypothetical protein F5J12DRAFT_905227 [Pisolithus orientalis]|uniref:uncharacterized protein n=1 Tax=Pisolithus orientalis TaxID=936130 RepID=UPI002225696C|nr:uncharacterized protein F5J12DRAFT_905227 [Pisolithus orientalis]KAI6008900.1 hypothetical protein F5J12DRAFT_905227 [Pisolithus orientalis]